MHNLFALSTAAKMYITLAQQRHELSIHDETAYLLNFELISLTDLI